MSYHHLKNQYRSNRKKEQTVKTILYIILISAVIIFWFVSAKSVKSLQEKLSKEAYDTQVSIEKNFQNKLKSSPKSAQELGILGENMAEKGYPQYALTILEEAIMKDNSIRDLDLYTAKLYYDLADYEKAKTTALLAQEKDPLYPPTYDLLAEIYRALGDEENANICYNKSKDFSTDNK